MKCLVIALSLLTISSATVVTDSVVIFEEESFQKIAKFSGPILLSFSINIIEDSTSKTFAVVTVNDDPFDYNKCINGGCVQIKNSFFKNVTTATVNSIVIPDGLWHLIIINAEFRLLHVKYSVTVESFESDNINFFDILLIVVACGFCGICCSLIVRYQLGRNEETSPNNYEMEIDVFNV